MRNRNIVIYVVLILALVLPSIALAAGTVGNGLSNTFVYLGDPGGGTIYRACQSFVITSGTLTEIEIKLDTGSGTPDVTAYIRSGSCSGSIVHETDPFTPNIGTATTITVDDGPLLDGTYYLVLEASGTGWYQALGYNDFAYADGQLYISENGGTWYSAGGNADLYFYVTNETVLPGEPLLISPSGSASASAPMFIWSSSSRATSYQLSVTDDSSETVHSQIYPASIVCDVVCETDNINLIAGTYEWEVTAYNAEGSTSSDTGSFTQNYTSDSVALAYDGLLDDGTTSYRVERSISFGDMSTFAALAVLIIFTVIDVLIKTLNRRYADVT